MIIPAPLPHQLAIHEIPARFKVARWGRRTGKTRWAFIAALLGHGPGWRENTPLYPGVLQGWDVCWIGRDYPQARQIWTEEIRPRFEGVPGCHVTESPFYSVAIQGGGTLHVRSAEAIASVRGIGKRLKGVIIDEAAWLDFDDCWLSVLRPALMDNIGWAAIMSTTNAGLDGNVAKLAPSAFNRLCAAIMVEQPGRGFENGWWHQHLTARDNPKISPEEFAATCAEYPEGSIKLAQEMEAKLLAAGSGLAFPEWRDAIHVVRTEPPADWAWFGGFDWGYAAPCAFYVMAAGGDREIKVRWERYVTGVDPYRTGYEIGQVLRRFPKLDWIGCDSAMWSVTDGGPTVAEEVQRGLRDSMGEKLTPTLIDVPKGPNSRITRKMLLHEALRYEEINGQVPAWLRPKLTVHPDCPNLIRTLPALPRNERRIEDVDTKAEDHGYDALTYPLLARVQQAEADPARDLPPSQDHHAGFQKVGGMYVEKNPWRGAAPETKTPFQTGVRWRRPQPGDE